VLRCRARLPASDSGLLERDGLTNGRQAAPLWLCIRTPIPGNSARLGRSRCLELGAYAEGVLLDAYYAGAIGVTVLKLEQARIATDTRAAEERLAAVDAHLAERQEILETATRFATNCAKAYALASAPTRRRFNQAVFTRIEVRDDKIVDVGYHLPFDLLFSSSEFEYGDRVEAMGLEPTNLLTASQALYQLSYAPEGDDTLSACRAGRGGAQRAGGGTQRDRPDAQRDRAVCLGRAIGPRVGIRRGSGEDAVSVW